MNHKDTKENPTYEDERRVNFYRRDSLNNPNDLRDVGDRYWGDRRAMYFGEMYKRPRHDK